MKVKFLKFVHINESKLVTFFEYGDQYFSALHKVEIKMTQSKVLKKLTVRYRGVSEEASA